MTIIVVDCQVEYQMTIAVMRKGEPMSDLISRQYAIDAIEKLISARYGWKTDARDEIQGLNAAYCAIIDLPSAQKTGKWIQAEDITTEYAVCTNCKGHGEFYMDYCWHCGARMVGEEE